MSFTNDNIIKSKPSKYAVDTHLRVVLLNTGNDYTPYSTHTHNLQLEAFSTGHYFGTLEDAEADYEVRMI